MTTTDDRPNVEYGNREMALGNEVLRTVVGSGLHGIEIEGTDDHDEMGVYVEPPSHVLGVLASGEKGSRDSYVYRTQPEGVRSGPGDVDLVLYSFRKFIGLAVKGNPTALMPLFAPESAVLKVEWLGEDLRDHRSSFLSGQAIERFLGYMYAQHDRMLGYGKRSAVPNRPELIEKYGFDTKYAAHALRLSMQGLEIADKARLTLPMHPADRGLIKDVKLGKVPREEVSKMITANADRVRKLIDTDMLAVPAEPDYQTINELSTRAHLAWWADKGMIR